MFSYSSSCCTVRIYYSTLDLPGNLLTLNDLGLLLEELMVVCQKWYVLGLMLNVSVQTLDRIRAQFPDSRDQLLEMLKTWLITSDNASWKTVTDALRSKSVEAYQLAGGLERKYCLTKDMRESKHQSVKSKDKDGW